MGRKLSIVEKSTSTTHSIVSISLLIACIVATIIVVSSLCGFSRKKQSSSNKKSDESVHYSHIEDITMKKNASSKSLESKRPKSPSLESSQRPQSPPKLKNARASSYHFQTNSSNASFGKLRASMSMRLQGGMDALSKSSRSEDHYKKLKAKNLKHEDSIWKKRIILGEKCRVPDEDDDDTILYDEDGNRISTYQPKKTATLPSLSRQCSAAIPS